MSKIISISCLKGGVGKTTTAVSLGGLLSSREQRTLLVDMDPQCNLTRTFTPGGFEETVYEAFRRQKGLPVVHVRENLDLVPSCPDACGIETEFFKRPNVNYHLRNLLSEVLEDYDWVLIDCPAQLGVATANALIAADSVLIPMSCDAYSCDGLLQISEFIEMARSLNSALTIHGVFLTKFRQRRRVEREVVDALESSEWKDKLFRTRIRECAAIVQAPICKTDIHSYAPGSTGDQDYSALLDEILERFNNVID